MAITTREWLAKATLSREMVDRFLDPYARNIWAFDAELGFGVRSCIRNDGVDGSKTVSHVEPSGERRMVNYAERPCRINTYGNSFNMSQQVSDGESWQEYLAAHFGEPIRNFGVGGYGVYQAYRRMLREEKTKSAAEHVVLHVFSEDHRRSIIKWRWLVGRYPNQGLEKTVFRRSETWGFFGNPWAHLRLDPTTGRFAEFENPYPTHDSLYLLCDEEHVYEAFKDDFEVQAFLAEKHASDIRPQVLQRMAEALEMPADFGSPEAAAKTATSLVQSCALRSSMYVLDEARAFARAEGRKLLVLLSHSEQRVIDACKGLPRLDQPFVSYMQEEGMPFVDTLDKHAKDFEAFRCSPEEYCRRFYYSGHYNPAGNHFFAFAVKDGLANWLEPRPPTYDPLEGPSL